MTTRPAKKLTLKQRKLIKARAEGKTLQQAGEIAGFSKRTAESQACQELKKPKVSEAFDKLLDQICPDSRLAEKYSNLLEAKKVISAMVIAGDGMKDANSMTKDFIEVDDCKVQLDTANSISKLKGYMVDRVQHDASEAIMAAVAARLSGGESKPGSKN